MTDQLRKALAHWDIELKALCPELSIAGSPERTESRIVIESAAGDLLIVERVKTQARKTKERIALTLEFLKSRGIAEVYPYHRSREGAFLVEAEGGLWQVVPYVPGVELSRPQYVFDAWRGEAAAEMLLRLRQASAASPLFAGDRIFSLPDYIEQLMTAIRSHRPDILERVKAMHTHVRENLYPGYSALPGAFCHGDYHSVNIIWKERGIAALIDWEFVGIKPELYDAANMMGCLGIEDPQCLWTGMGRYFIARLMAGGDFSSHSRALLLELVIGLRFAWLSEWLRKKDDEMVEMELDYFDVLSGNAKELSLLWQNVSHGC